MDPQAHDKLNRIINLLERLVATLEVAHSQAEPEALKRHARKVVWEYIKMYGPMSLKNLELDHPGGLTSKEARVAAQNLVNEGYLFFDSKLKLDVKPPPKSEPTRLK